MTHRVRHSSRGSAAAAAELVRSRVAVIVANGTPAALAANVANTTIPIVFATGGDPIALSGGTLERAVLVSEIARTTFPARVRPVYLQRVPGESRPAHAYS